MNVDPGTTTSPPESPSPPVGPIKQAGKVKEQGNTAFKGGKFAEEPTPTTSTSSSSKNPISLRLYKVLSTNFDDYATREALDTLSELYGHTDEEGNVASNAKVDEEDDESSLAEHAAKARRSLRRDMENKLAESSGHFVQALGEVDQKLAELQKHIAAMHAACAEAEDQLRSTNDASKSVLERAGNLRDERQEIETKISIISLFLHTFTLTETETALLTSRDLSSHPISPAFFAALSRTQRIQADCRVLMAAEDGAPTRAGTEVMARTAGLLEAGYERMGRFLGMEFRGRGMGGGGGAGEVVVHPLVRECVRRLRKHRPELLSESLSLLSQTRQQALLTAFLTALTRGGPSGLPRPIELHAHDPLRYVGDMLAWVHQGVAEEVEFLEGLFLASGGAAGERGEGDRDGEGGGGEGEGSGRETRRRRRRMVGSVRRAVRRRGPGDGGGGGTGDWEGEEEEEWVAELLDLAVEKLCVPLKNRVLQTVKSQESSIVLYKIANLLRFYSLTMGRTVGFDAVLTRNLVEITDVAYKTFETSIEAQSRALAQRPLDVDDASLTPPLFVLDHAQVLREVMSVYQSSVLDEEEEEEEQREQASLLRLASSSSADASAGAISGAGPSGGMAAGVVGALDFGRILDVVVDPLVESIVMGAEEKRRVRPRWDAGVWVVNCLIYLLGILEPFEKFTKRKMEGIQRVLDEKVKVIVDEHFTTILSETGLATFHAFIQHPPTPEPLSRFPQTSIHALRSALHIFSMWLSSSSIILPPTRLQALSQPALAGRVHRAALREVVRVYEEVVEVVRSRERGAYEAAEIVIGGERPWGRGEVVRSILGVEEEEEEEEDESEDENDGEEEESEGQEEEQGGLIGAGRGTETASN